MKNLAIECSGTAGSVGISEDGTLLCFVELDAKVGSVQTLAPQIDQLVKRFGRPDTISVTNGPGSFTGLRVGLSMAKMLGFAWKTPIISVNTLHAIALRSRRLLPPAFSDSIILPIVNAFRGQLFATAVKISELNLIQPHCESVCVDARQWCNDPFSTLGISVESKVLFTGPGLANYLPELKLPAESEQIAPASMWQPTAIEVDILGLQQFSEGSCNDPLSLTAAYIRASAAEEKAG
jgi:tRNA threonylcarbamoyladenosine biosynthesis protein TsaB